MINNLFMCTLINQIITQSFTHCHFYFVSGFWCWQHHGSCADRKHPSTCWSLRCCLRHELPKRCWWRHWLWCDQSFWQTHSSMFTEEQRKIWNSVPVSGLVICSIIVAVIVSVTYNCVCVCVCVCSWVCVFANMCERELIKKVITGKLLNGIKCIQFQICVWANWPVSQGIL